MKYNNSDIGGSVIKNDDTYKIIDNTMLTRLVLSQTILHPQKSTRGHSHPGQEEIYCFISGSGTMEVGEDVYQVKLGDIILVPDGAFHRVHNTSHQDLIFNCVFEGDRNH